MAFNFGNWLEEAWANVNPFDNGATAKTVVAARKRKAAPAVTPAQTSSPTRIGGSNQLASPKAVQLTMPKTHTISTTKLMNKDEIMAFNFGNRKKNLAEIDAIQKKAQADIWDPAKIAGDIGKSVGQVASGAAKGVVDAGTGMINDYGKRVADTGEAAATVIRQLNGENQAFDKHMQDLATNANQTDINVLKRLQTESDPMKRKQLQKVLSLDARGTAINSMQNAQQQQLQATDPRKTLVNAGNTALDVLTLGKGKAILDGVRATQKVTAPVLRQLAKNTALSFLQGAGIGAAYSGVNTAIDPNASPLDYARNMGQGAAMGAAVGIGAQVVFPVAGVAAKQAVKGTESAIVRSANYGLKPPTNLSKDELYVASKVRQAREGYISPQDITVQEAAIYQNVQRKLGAKPGTPDGEMAVVHALGAHRNFDTQRTLRKDATLNALEKSSDFTRQHLVPGGTLMGVKAKGFKDAQAKGLIFDGVDGKPRFEVDDSGARLLDIATAKPSVKPERGEYLSLGDVLRHDKLFDQYPQLKDVPVHIKKERGSIANVSSTKVAGKEHYAMTVSPGVDLGDVLHETQHLIQGQENFARGGASSEFKTKSIPAKLKNVDFKRFNVKNQIRNTLRDTGVKVPHNVKNGDWSIASLENPKVRELARKHVPELLAQYDELNAQLSKYQTSTAQYERLAGEAEARAVEARMNMPMSERYVKGKQYYHGSPDADKIRKEGFKIGERTADKRAPVFGDGVYMTTIKDAAEPYAKRGAFKSATGEVLEVNIPENLKLADVSVDDAFKPKVIERLKKQGYDGVRNDDIVNIFDPKKVNLGKATPRSTFYDSLDVPKEDLIIRNDGGKAMSVEKDPLESLKQEARKFETLPSDIHPSLEAKAVGQKRIAPDRVAHQQLTPQEGIKRLVQQSKEMYDKRSAGWTKIAADADALIKKYGDKMPLRRSVDLNKYPDFEKDMAMYNYLKKNTYGTTGGSISKMRDQFVSNSERTGWNAQREAQALKDAPKQYIEAVRKDISKGYRYPDEVLNHDPSFRKAIDSRARYEKGLYTSFSSDDHRIVFDEQNRIAGGMKRQDGKELTPSQKEEIVNGIIQTQKVLGINLDQLAKDNRWVYAHLNGKNPFLTQNAAGLYRGGKDHASISVGGTETFKTIENGKQVTKRVNTTMAHELGHALDLSGDKRLFDREAIWKLKNSYNSTEGGFRGRSYWGNDKEVTARAIAQYVAYKEGHIDGLFEKPGNWDKNTFETVIAPEVERAIKAKYPEYTSNPQQLTDLYNQAHTEAKPAAPKVEAPKGAPIEKTPLDTLKQEARDIQATIESPYLNTLPPAQAQSKLAGYRRRLAEINKQLNANDTVLNGNEPKLNGNERKITGNEPKLNQVEPKSTETVYKITARNQAGVIKQLRELSKKADRDGNTTLGDKLYKLADDVMYDRQYEYFGNKGYKRKLEKLVRDTAQSQPPKSTPKTDPMANLPELTAKEKIAARNAKPPESQGNYKKQLNDFAKEVKSQSTPVQKPNIDPNRNSSQRSGRQNPLPDNKARTGRTYPDDTPDIDTAQYVKDMGRSQKSAMQSELGIKAKAADFKEKFIDDLSPIEDRLNKAIKDGASVDVKDHITYQLDRSRRAEGVMNAYVRDNGLDKIIQNVDNVDEFDQYLIARHAKELDPEITTGRDIAKDAALVRQLEGKYGEKAKELYAYNQKLLDTSVDYGLISKESAAALKKQYPDYVPFNRIFNEDELANLYGGAGKGDASLSSQNVVKKIKGSNRAIASPLNSIIDKTRVVVEQGERNRAAQMLANYRELPGNPYNLKEIPKNETIGTRHTISYLDKGVKRTFETDKVIADAAKNMTRQEIGLWGRIAAVPARVLRGGATTVNIGFAGANVVKDVIGAAINSKHPFRIADPKAFGKALSAALEHDGPYYQELMREGVAGTSFDMYRNPLKSNIGEIRSHKNLGTRAAYNVTHPSQWYRTLENTIGRSEDFGRALQYYSNKSGFEAKLGKGSKDAKTLAADQARHNSTNFFRHGSAGKGINLAIPYWNAGVQGARIQTRRIAERPVQTVAKIGFAIAAPSAMIAMNNYSTPERQEIMDNIQDYEKEGNIIILGANPHMNQETGKWEDVYKIPVPPQHIGIHTAVQDAVRSAKTGEGFDVLKNLGKITQNYTTVNPTNLRETASSYTPQALKLVAEPMTNTNFFTGNKIVPESQKNLPAKDQFGDYTSGTAKILGGITNISPRQIDNAIRTGTGGAGQNALWASDKMLAGTGAIEAKDVKGQDPLTSITRRFSGAASVSASDKAENLFKKYKEQVVQSNEYKNASQYDKQRMLNRLQNDLSAVEWDKTGKSEKNLTGKQKALKSDGFDPSVYTNLDNVKLTSNLDTGSSDILSKYNNMSSDERENWFAKNNDAEYKYYKAKYENDKANGEISKIEDIRRQKMLKKDEVGAKYTKDTRDLYSLSKAEVSDYLSSAKNGNQLAKELIAYDEALYNAGLVKYKKFRYGFASSSGGGRSRGGRKSSRNGAKKFSYSLSEFAPKKGTSKNKQLYDLLKEARKKYA